MLHKWRCALLKGLQFSNDQFPCVIRAAVPVATHIFKKSAEDGICRALQNDQGIHHGKRRYVAGLSCVPGDTIQDKKITIAELKMLQGTDEDLPGEHEAVVLQEKTVLQDVADEFNLRR